MAPKNLLSNVPPTITQPDRALAAVRRFSERHPLNRASKIPALLRTAEIVQEAAKRPLSQTRVRKLFRGIAQAVFDYRYSQFVKDVESKTNLHEIASSLTEVIIVLEHLENIPHILVALGAPRSSVTFGMGYGEPAQQAMAQYEIMLLGLRKIRDKVPPPPPKNPRGKPPAHNLHQLVDRLADIWETFTEREFTQGWHKEKGESKPISNGARFVHAVVKVVDPERLKSVPDVTEQVVKRRRRKPTSVK
jgi:hypothetical protein